MAKIVSITPKGQWQDLFKLEIRFDNGDFGTAFAKSPTPSYAVGDEVDYTKNEKGTIKINKPFGGGFGGGSTPSYTPSYGGAKSDDRSASIIRQVALKAAVEYACAAGHDVNTILANAATFNEWMNGNQSTATHQEHFATRNESPF
jgi:hypothetical protein